METVGAYEAKTHLSRLLDKVARGESVTITKHGVPVAILVPPRAEDVPLSEVFADIAEVRRGIDLDGLSVRDLIDEGRR